MRTTDDQDVARATFGIPGMRISGKLWGAVLVQRGDGTTVLRALPARKPRRSPSQGDAAARLKPVGEAWRRLTSAEATAWRQYSGGGGREAYLAFTRLGTKCLQMRPLAALPTLPPVKTFEGDGIWVEVQPSDGLDVAQCHGDEGTGAGIRFSANAPNSPGVVTELLLQRIANCNRTPEEKAYKSHTFMAFAPGALETTIEVPSGPWACAVRFVREATGQAAGLVELGVLEVR